MKVSIVTVVFNSVSVIEETILSVIYQKNGKPPIKYPYKKESL